MAAYLTAFALFVVGLSARALPAEVLIIRHAEKPAVAVLGKTDGRDLSPKGCQRANALASLFTKDARMLEFGLPVAIYAGSPKKSDTGSLRPLETIQPTAKELGFSPITSFISDDFASMADEVMTKAEYEGKTVLISWPHDKIPDIASAFGVNKSQVPQWDGSIFDRVWKIKFGIKGSPVFFENLPQHLLPGDSAN